MPLHPSDEKMKDLRIIQVENGYLILKYESHHDHNTKTWVAKDKHELCEVLKTLVE